MDKSYEFEEAEYEEGITFKKVGYFFKKGWLRAVIYVAVCLLLATAIALPIRSFWKSEPVAQATLEFIYDGIEDGKAPDGSILNSENIISVTVLAQAVEKAGLDQALPNISVLRQAMRVEGVNTDEYVALVKAAEEGDSNAANTLRSYVMHPTSFTIVISDPEALGLSDSQSILLLENVLQCYYSDFLKRYSVQNMFAGDIFTLTQNQSIEFADIYDIYKSALTSMQSTLVKLSESGPDYISRINDAGFTNLVSDFVILSSKLDLFNAFISSNNIWLNKSAARDALEASKIEINNNLPPLKAYIESLNNQIKMIQLNTTTTGTEGDKTVTVSYPNEYFVYHERLNEANREVRDYEAKLASIEARLEKLSNTESTPSSLVSEASSRLKGIESEASLKIALANSVINDYYQTQFISQSVRQVRPPVVTRRGMTFSLMIVYLAAAVAGLLVACLVTAVKISLAKSARQKAEKESDKDTLEQDDTKK